MYDLFIGGYFVINSGFNSNFCDNSYKQLFEAILGLIPIIAKYSNKFPGLFILCWNFFIFFSFSEFLVVIVILFPVFSFIVFFIFHLNLIN